MAHQLEALWKNRLATLLTNLAKGLREHEEVASLAGHIGADYAGRFLIELLQNANDQALLGGAKDSTIVIVRTSDAIVVTNEGASFDEQGLLAITSLGVSPKNADVTIGNKGVGFKAVFQVTEAPELFSAPPSAQAATFGDEGGLWFRFHREPLSQPTVAERLDQLIEETLRERPGDADEFAARYAGDPSDGLRDAIRESAPFRYPIPLDRGALDARLRQLELPSPGCAARTLVVLPLLRDVEGTVDVEAAEVVATAFAELRSHGDAIVLFLDGVSRIVVDDRVTGERHVLAREAPTHVEDLPRGSQYIELRTVRETTAGESVTRESQRWLAAHRTIGAPRAGFVSEAEAEKEQAALSAAAGKLPGRNWNKVRTADVTVALPVPEGDEEIGAPLARNGLICIGLPTSMKTGVPLWVDARFHGNLPRTEVYWSHSYNAQLLREAVALVEDLVLRWKADSSIGLRRLPALAMAPTDGILKEHLHAAGSLAWTSIVLARDGQSFFRAANLVVPAPDDIAVFGSLAAAIPDLGDYGFVLPDNVLLAHARRALDALPASGTVHGALRPLYLQRPGGKPSMLEAAAQYHRASSPSFWEPFLLWVTKQFPVQQLEDQRILPTGKEGLECPRARVFLRPMPRARGTAPAGGADNPEEVALDEPPSDGPQVSPEDDDDEAISNRLPREVARTLPFLDESAVRVRLADRALLTEVGRAIAPERGEKLVRRPEAAEVINDLFGPRLRALGQEPEDLRLGLVLLRTAVRWMRTMTRDRRAAIVTAGLRVPVVAGDGCVAWIAPGEATFGEGWLDGRMNELLGEMARRRPGRFLLPWAAFASAAGASATEASRVAWRDDLRSIDVATGPQIIRAGCGKVAPFVTVSYSHLTPNVVPCPIPAAEPYWKDYLDTIAVRPVAVATYQEYEIEDVFWIDGLEDDELRPIVVELVFRDPPRYAGVLQTKTRRRHVHKDAVVAPALWVNAMREEDWDVIPTDRDGICGPGVTFRLEEDQRRLGRVELLPTVLAELQPAAAILESIGVPLLANASPMHLSRALHRLASRLPLPAGDAEDGSALAHDLFDRLQNRCRGGNVDLTYLASQPVPLEEGASLVPARLRELDRVFVADDAIRFRLLAPLSPLSLPLRSGDRFVAFVETLRRAIGADRIVYASETPVDSGFAPAQPGAGRPVLEVLAQHFPGCSIETDLALVVAYMGQQEMEPTKARFREVWRDLVGTRLVEGSFADSFPHSSLIEKGPDGRQLLVAIGSRPADIVAALYAVAGTAHRHAFTAYARALEASPQEVDRFFRGEVSPAQRDEVAAAIGAGRVTWAAAVKPAIFALWRKNEPNGSVDSFHRAWREGLDLHGLVALVGSDGLVDRLRAAARSNDDALWADLLREQGIDGAQFREACRLLGERWEFQSTRRMFARLRADLIAVLRTAVARSTRKDLDLGAADTALQGLNANEPPADVLETLPDRVTVLEALLAGATAAASGMAADHPIQSLLQDYRVSDLSRCELVRDSKFPAREVEEYRNRDVASREADAGETLSALMKVAEAVAAKEGETLHADAVRGEQRVAARTAGAFANRFSLLATLRDHLEKVAPATTARLTGARAFHEPTGWQALWKRLEGLLGPPDQPPTPPPPRKVHVLDLSIDEASVRDDLALGTSGQIGQRITEVVVQNLDLLALRSCVHGPPPVVITGRPPGTKRRGSGKSHKDIRTDRDRVGLLGEIFVLEQLKKALPGFDESNWTSENRGAWAGLDAGSDEYAADFDYVDADGKLTGLPHAPKAYIEVKSSSGDADQPFYMTLSEWQRAEACHHSGGTEVYVIVRVAFADTAPRIADILIDPVVLKNAGQLALSETEFWVGVGKRQIIGESDE